MSGLTSPRDFFPPAKEVDNSYRVAQRYVLRLHLTKVVEVCCYCYVKHLSIFGGLPVTNCWFYLLVLVIDSTPIFCASVAVSLLPLFAAVSLTASVLSGRLYEICMPDSAVSDDLLNMDC